MSSHPPVLPAPAGTHDPEREEESGRGVERSLGRRTMRAARWKAAAAFAQAGLQFGVGILLARLLTPNDFGLVALAAVVLGFAEVLSGLGVGASLIRLRPLSERHVRVSFTISLLFGAFLTFALYTLAPVAARLLGDDAVRSVLRALAVPFLFSGLGATSHALLHRRLDFRRLFWIRITSYGLGYAGVAVPLALAGWGVWSLVWGTILQSLLQSGLAYALVRHPLRPSLARQEVRDLLDFGVGFSLSQMVNYIARNGDNFIAGRWLGLGALGLYSRAYNLMMLPLTYVGNVAGSVLFPALSEIHEDRERLGRAYLLAVQLVTLVSAPVMAGFVVAAPHLVLTLYGAPWAGVTGPLQVLCAVGVFRVIYNLSCVVPQAVGRIYSEFVRQVGYMGLVVVGGLVGARFGLLGLSIGVAIAIVYMYFAMAQLSLQIVGIRWRDFAHAHVPGAAVALWVASAGLVVRGLLEGHGTNSGIVFGAIVVTSSACVPLGLFLLPPAVRPYALYQRLAPFLNAVPKPFRTAVGRVLHFRTI